MYSDKCKAHSKVRFNLIN